MRFSEVGVGVGISTGSFPPSLGLGLGSLTAGCLCAALSLARQLRLCRDSEGYCNVLGGKVDSSHTLCSLFCRSS